jgi:amino acid transporter
MGVTIRLGGAIAAGVPALVLVSMGPVATLAGTPSIAVWVLSAVVGFLMALLFAELAGAYPGVNGGVAPLAATVLRPYSRMLARGSQWSYWLGWCPAPAINGLVIAGYGQVLLFPDAPSWTAIPVASAILLGSVAVNHFGLRVGGRLQLVLICCVTATVVALFGGALVRGGLALDSIGPFAPPDGWRSGSGWLAIAGALFLAGWSAYAAELSLTYSVRYRRGVRDAVQVLVAVAGASVVAFTLVPFLLVATVGIDAVKEDPVVAFEALGRKAVGGAVAVVMVMLMLALLLGLNMIAIGSSWALHQMARTGDAWAALGRLNRHGVPGNALRFDLAVNLGLVALVAAASGGDVSRMPIGLLVAANVAYFVSMGMALIAAWLNHRRGPACRVIRLRPALARLAPVLVGFQAVLLAAAGYAWGWRNLAIGAAVLVGVVALGQWLPGHAGTRASQPRRSLPACWSAVPAGGTPGGGLSRERPTGGEPAARRPAVAGRQGAGALATSGVVEVER